jgi:signal transduction histidine kinase
MSSSWTDRLQRTFGLRLAWWYAVVFAISATALVLITYLLLTTTLRRQDREFIQTTLVQFAAAYVGGGPNALAREIQRAEDAGLEGPLFVRTVRGRRDVLFLSTPERWRQFDPSQLAEPELSGQRSWATLATGNEGENLEVLSVRLPDGTLFQVGKSIRHREDLLSRFRRALLFNVLFILLIGIAGGAMVTHSALQPLRALTATVSSIMHTGRTSARVPVQSPGDALGDLTVLVNAMLDRIDSVVGGMRGALDNVAHDLRTPLARLRGTAESALSSEDPVVLRNALADSLEESDRIIAMLNTLMDISEAETGTMALRRERTRLQDIVAETIDLYEHVADEGGVEIQTEVRDDIVLDVDRNRFRQVLANLVDNALKYTPAGGRVRITAARDDDAAVRLLVSDTGAGIPTDELPHVWTRLYRGDKSRSTRGLGLGLSLVKAIVEAHGGQVAIASEPQSGTQVSVRIPAANLSQL